MIEPDEESNAAQIGVSSQSAGYHPHCCHHPTPDITLQYNTNKMPESVKDNSNCHDMSHENKEELFEEEKTVEHVGQ